MNNAFNRVLFGCLVATSTLLTASLVSGQTVIKPRVMLMVDTSGSMAEDTVNTNAVGGDGSISYQDSQVTIGANQSTPNYSPYPGYSSSNTCPPAATTLLGFTSKMAAAKQAVTNVINGSGDIDWGLMRYTGASVAFPTSTTRNNRSINPDPDISPNRNPMPVICTADNQCPTGQTCNNAVGNATQGRCTKQRCTTDAQCTASPAAAGQTCDLVTGQCTCANQGQCGGTLLCAAGECRGQGGAACTLNTQCASNSCGSNGLCACSADNQCLNGCNTRTGECRCNNDNQCPGGSTCDDTTDQCVVGSAAPCKSGIRMGSSNQCGCASNAQCPGGSTCDVSSGRCKCTANNQCRSNICRVDTGECACTASSQCWGAATCNGATGECEAKANSDCPSGARNGTGNINCTCNGTTAQCLNGKTCTGGLCQCTTSADCRNGGTCTGGTCTDACATENDCGFSEWCISGQCGYPNTLSYTTGYGETDTRGGTACGPHAGLRVSYGGNCGTGINAGGVCATQQSCFADAGCTGAGNGQCALIGAGPARSCTCSGNANCPADYACSGGRCVYNLGCRSVGGQILVDPSAAAYAATQVLPYADGVEIFTAGGNPELRANGATPLGGSARSATAWYAGIRDATVGSPLYDPKLACRPYILVLLTDGVDTCDNTNGGNADEGAVAGSQGFVTSTVSGARVANRVEVIGLSVNVPADQTRLNNIAQAGSSRTTARFANNQSDLEAALADIVASSVLFESCNNADDNCNGQVDEGLGVFEDCIPGSACLAGTCDAAGHCPCNGSLANQCDPTFVCNKIGAGGSCVPSCDVGVGACLKSGVRKCGGNCCVNDGNVACVALVAGAGTTEICNNLDDNCNGQIDEGNVCTTCQPTVETCNGLDDDCNGALDNNLVDVGLPCGSDEGECSAGTTACQALTGTFPNTTDRIVCAGALGPFTEVCDGKDNNCDGVIDGMTQACYTPGLGSMTRNVGVCRDGQQACTAALGSGVPMWGACAGEITPTTEICNGLDDDCNGVPDDVTGTNVSCCSSGTCGVGICVAGKTQCSGGVISCVGEIGPQQEICDGLDNDCNGMVDDVPGKGAACTPGAGNCGGHLACNTSTHALDCIPDAPAPEICNGVDDDCDGFIDEVPDVGNNDTRLGKDCDAPVAPANLPPCKAGTSICVNGQVACDGAVKPDSNVCGQPSRDCQTAGVFNGNCPAGFECYDGTCASPCGAGEFPCPGGFVCRMNSATGSSLCVSDACTKITCPMGQFCQLDDQGNAVCNDPCKNVECPQDYRCKEGLCVDDSCRTFGCAEGQVCQGTNCIPDPCFNKICDVDQYCAPDSGNCVRACVGPCPTGETCVDGECSGDPCASKKCASGQACFISLGIATCVVDQCSLSGCDPDSVCCGGSCAVDQCKNIGCPGGSKCQVNTSCAPYCQADEPEQVVGAGGGGFACDVGGLGVARGTTGGGGWIVIVVLGLFLARRQKLRGREGQAQ